MWLHFGFSVHEYESLEVICLTPAKGRNSPSAKSLFPEGWLLGALEKAGLYASGFHQPDHGASAMQGVDCLHFSLKETQGEPRRSSASLPLGYWPEVRYECPQKVWGMACKHGSGCMSGVYTLVWRRSEVRGQRSAWGIATYQVLGVSHLVWNSAIWLGQMASEPPPHFLYSLAQSRDYKCAPPNQPAFFMWSLEVKLSLLCLLSKNLTGPVNSLTLWIDGSLLWFNCVCSPIFTYFILTPSLLYLVPLLRQLGFTEDYKNGVLIYKG